MEKIILRKPPGSYTIPERVIDAVINNILSGTSVTKACKAAGITRATLYNRLKAKGMKIEDLKIKEVK